MSLPVNVPTEVVFSYDRSLHFFVVPGEVVNVDINLAEWTRRGSRLLREQPSRERVAYFSGAMAGINDAKNHQLNLIAEGDYRGAVAGGQAFVISAPVSLVLVSDLSRFGDTKNAHTQLMGAMDAGIVSQNISIFCSAARLATVPRASMDINQLKKVLKLKESQVPMMNHPIGYLK